MKCEFSTHFGSCFLKLHDISTSRLEALVSGTAQEAGAGGRYGAVDILVHGSLMGHFLYLYGFLHFSFGSLWLSG